MIASAIETTGPRAPSERPEDREALAALGALLGAAVDHHQLARRAEGLAVLAEDDLGRVVVLRRAQPLRGPHRQRVEGLDRVAGEELAAGVDDDRDRRCRSPASTTWIRPAVCSPHVDLAAGCRPRSPARKRRRTTRFWPVSSPRSAPTSSTSTSPRPYSRRPGSSRCATRWPIVRLASPGWPGPHTEASTSGGTGMGFGLARRAQSRTGRGRGRRGRRWRRWRRRLGRLGHDLDRFGQRGQAELLVEDEQLARRGPRRRAGARLRTRSARR